MPPAVGFLAGLGTFGQIVASVVFNAALGAISKKLVSPRSERSGSVPPDFSRQETVSATDEYETFVYGRVLLGGQLVYKNAVNVNSANDVMFNMVKWAGHEVNCMEMFRFDDFNFDPTVDSWNWDTTSYGTGTTGVIQSGRLRGNTQRDAPTALRTYRGDQSSSDQRAAQEIPEWTTDHVGAGRAYGILELRAVNEGDSMDIAWPSGFPRNVQALIHGRSVYDPRRHALNGDPRFLNTESFSTYGPGSADLNYGLSGGWELVDGVGGPNNVGVQLTDNDSGAEPLMTEVMPCDPSSTYTLFLEARRISGDRPCYFGMSFWTDQGSNLSGQTGIGWPSFGTYAYSLVNTQLPADFVSLSWAIGSGGYAVPASARLMRVSFWGISSNAAFAQNTTQVQAREMGIYLGTDSRQFVDQPSTWRYSTSPPPCMADYLRNEEFGFGKEARVRMTPTRFALNEDSGFRRYGNFESSSYWIAAPSPNSAQQAILADEPAVSLSTSLSGPYGRRGITYQVSDGTSDFGRGIWTEQIPVDREGHYVYHVAAMQEDSNSDNILAVAFLDSNGDYISPSADPDSVGWQTTSFWHYFPHTTSPNSFQGPLSLNVWSTYVYAFGSGTGFNIPNSARTMRVGALTTRSPTGDSTVHFQNLLVRPGTTVKHFIEPWEQIHWGSVASLSAYTDQQVSTPSGTQARWTMNGASNTGKSYRSNLNEMMSSVPGMRIVYSQSGFQMLGGWEEPTRYINISDITGRMKIRPEADRRDRFNHVRGIFHDSQQDFKAVPYATVSAAEYIARDHSADLYEDNNLRWCTDWYEAQRNALAVLEQGDNQLLLEVPLKAPWWALSAGRHVGMNLGVASWENRTFLMTDLKHNVPDVTVVANLREDSAVSYVDPSTGEYISREGTLSVVSGSLSIPQISSVSIVPRIGGVQLSWSNPSARRFEWVDVYRNTTNAFSGSTLLKTTRSDEFLDSQVPAGQEFYYWWQTKDFRGNVGSVYPGLTTSFTGVSLFPVHQDPEYVFLEEFNYQTISEFEQKWQLLDTTSNGPISFPTSGVFGGRVLQASGGTVWAVSRTRIPYDPEALYQMRTSIREVTSSSNRSTYIGFTGFRADGATPISISSVDSYTDAHYFVRRNHLSVGAGWIPSIGHVRGHMAWPNSGTASQNTLPSDPNQAARMHSLVKYVSPMFLLNYSGGVGVQQIDYLSVAKVKPANLVWDHTLTDEEGWVSASAGTSTGINSAASLLSMTSPNIPDYRTSSIDGEYGVAAFNANAFIGWELMTERARPEFHRLLPSSGTVLWQSRMKVLNSTIPFYPMIIAYTRQNSVAGVFLANSPLPLAANSWTSYTGTIPVSVASINQSTFPPPYFMSVGLALDQGINLGTSYFVCQIDAIPV